MRAATVSEVRLRLRHGDLLEAVHEHETEADLIVIGKRGEAADFATLHLGSNLERVVRSSHKPVLVASRAFKPIKRFLIAFDGGASVMKAVEYIARTEPFRDLECRLLMAGSPADVLRERLHSAARMLEAAGYSVQAAIEPGQPEAVIAGTVENDAIDLLVMGAYGHSRVRNLIIGSTTTEMVRSCKIPVLMFR